MVQVPGSGLVSDWGRGCRVSASALPTPLGHLIPLPLQPLPFEALLWGKLGLGWGLGLVGCEGGRPGD